MVLESNGYGVRDCPGMCVSDLSHRQYANRVRDEKRREEKRRQYAHRVRQ
jgi:hypothetical protein